MSFRNFYQNSDRFPMAVIFYEKYIPSEPQLDREQFSSRKYYRYQYIKI